MTHSKPTIQRIEMKFQLDADMSAQVKDWARDHLGVDENCNAAESDSYDIRTLYLDTPELDLFHRTRVIGLAKHRIRRYGNEQTLWVETKRKKKQIVRKNRTAVFESDLLARLSAPEFASPKAIDLQNANGPLSNVTRPKPTSEPRGTLASNSMEALTNTAQVFSEETAADPWCGDWFLKRIAERRLQPAVQIGYRRFARTSMLNGENLRLTIDSHMSTGPVDDWKVSTGGARQDLAIGEHEILELKFNNQMPALFKKLLRTFPIPATGFSKFRSGIVCRSLHQSETLTNEPLASGRPLANKGRMANA
ncbi:VTC domain protein [Roseimaritima multifibrata]|uniref:VTC domain protein n=1 Tax=Roseimaritima multifibrata TaxID=1930274 RepID=A0A517MGL1_9BACT|nr:polyphosphate polymerase domain-containing protein [Roseimaritima multifibrata]QDS94024.1 VTC domain protein [Roseimaritima multifibrata]